MASDDPLVTALGEACTGAVVAGPELREFTTLKVGGPSRALVTAETDADLVAVGRACARHGAPWLVLGRGSNLLVADAGWPGVAITLGPSYRGYAVDGDLVRAGAAEMLPALSVRLANEGFVGFAWASAVPGSLGGGVRMNAGAHGGEMSDHLVEVDVVRLSTGARETWPADTLGMRYRRTELPDDAVVVSATLRLERGPTDETRAEIREIKRWRRDNQPVTEPNCGSVFTNPDGDSAGRLVESVGAKGLVVGGAHISDKHANFIVTGAGATASHVRALIRTVRQRVAEEHGVVLRPEVVMVGDFDDEGIDVQAREG